MTSKLKVAREEAGYTIQQVAEKLKIRRQYIVDLEEENFDNIPGKIYVEGYTKMYSNFLHIDNPFKEDLITDIPKILLKDARTNSQHQRYIILISICILASIVVIYDRLTERPDNKFINTKITNNGSKSTNVN